MVLGAANAEVAALVDDVNPPKGEAAGVDNDKDGPVGGVELLVVVNVLGGLDPDAGVIAAFGVEAAALPREGFAGSTLIGVEEAKDPKNDVADVLAAVVVAVLNNDPIEGIAGVPEIDVADAVVELKEVNEND